MQMIGVRRVIVGRKHCPEHLAPLVPHHVEEGGLVAGAGQSFSTLIRRPSASTNPAMSIAFPVACSLQFPELPPPIRRQFAVPRCSIAITREPSTASAAGWTPCRSHSAKPAFTAQLAAASRGRRFRPEVRSAAASVRSSRRHIPSPTGGSVVKAIPLRVRKPRHSAGSLRSFASFIRVAQPGESPSRSGAQGLCSG
jgi:hypothetical protein